MSPDATTDAVQVLRAAADGFRNHWTAAKPALNGAEASLGNGPLGAAFMGAYGPGIPGTLRMAEGSGRLLQHTARAGAASVEQYLDADSTARSAFPGQV